MSLAERRPAALVLTLIACLLALVALARPAAADQVRMADGRWYRIDMPRGVANPPLIIALHGGGGSPDQFARASGLDRAALAAGFAVAFPAGTGRTRLLTWNGLYCCGSAQRGQVDDIAFLDRVIADAATRFGTDPARVYVTGMSNGAILAETYAALRPGKLRAVAGVSGTLDLRQVRPAGPVAMMHIHGTADDRVLYAGGSGGQAVNDAPFTPAETAVAAFVRAAGIAAPPREERIDPADDGMHVDRLTWGGAGASAQIVLLRIVGGGHDWPGGPRGGRRGASRDISANAEILAFFKAH